MLEHGLIPLSLSSVGWMNPIEFISSYKLYFFTICLVQSLWGECSCSEATYGGVVVTLIRQGNAEQSKQAHSCEHMGHSNQLNHVLKYPVVSEGDETKST